MWEASVTSQGVVLEADLLGQQRSPRSSVVRASGCSREVPGSNPGEGEASFILLKAALLSPWLLTLAFTTPGPTIRWKNWSSNTKSSAIHHVPFYVKLILCCILHMHPAK